MKETKLTKALHRIRVFITSDIWEVDLANIAWIKRPFIKLLRIMHMSVRGLRDDELPLRASGLTFVTLLSIAPLLAFVFTIFRGMGRGQEAMMKLRDSLATMPDQVQEFLNTVLEYVENTSAVGIGGTAVIILLFTVIKVMSSIERTFNKVWGVTTSRTLLRKFTDYISTLVLVPMLILAASALAGLRNSDRWTEELQAVYTLTDRLLVFAPLFAAWIAFSMLYLFMPNTRVRFKPAMVSGLVAALLWGGWQSFYIRFQGMLLTQQDKVFGAFASIPIFMFWLYVCWVIVLFGAEVAFAMQNYATHAQERHAYTASDESRLLVAMAVIREASRAMTGEAPVFRADVFGQARGVPIRLLNDVIKVLSDGGLLSELAEDRNAHALIKAPGQIRVKDVIDLVLCQGSQPDQLGLDTLDPEVVDAWSRADGGMDTALDGATFAQPTTDDGGEPGTGPVKRLDSYGV